MPGRRIATLGVTRDLRHTLLGDRLLVAGYTARPVNVKADLRLGNEQLPSADYCLRCVSKNANTVSIFSRPALLWLPPGTSMYS